MDIDAILSSGSNLYQTWIPDFNIKFSYRILSLKEYKLFKALRAGNILSEEETADRVFERCLIGEASLLSNDLPAGLTVSIGRLILYLSGDCDAETLLTDISTVRELNPQDTVFEYMRSVICTTFKNYTIEEIDSWDRPRFIKNFVISENVLSKQNPDYQKLDLKKIKTKSSNDTSSNEKANIDFESENRSIRKAVGQFDIEDAQQGKLSVGQLKKISAAKRG
jgi:hypothetical protein